MIIGTWFFSPSKWRIFFSNDKFWRISKNFQVSRREQLLTADAQVNIIFIFSQTTFLTKIILFSYKNHVEHENPRHITSQNNYVFYKLHVVLVLLFLRNINFAQKRMLLDCSQGARKFKKVLAKNFWKFHVFFWIYSIFP